jgi:hypothetical protein
VAVFLSTETSFWVECMGGFKILVLGIEQKMLQSRPPELMLVDLCSIFQAGAVGNSPWANFGRKPTQIGQNLKLKLLS